MDEKKIKDNFFYVNINMNPFQMIFYSPSNQKEQLSSHVIWHSLEPMKSCSLKYANRDDVMN